MTADVIHRFNEAFRLHDTTELPALVDEECVLENVDGTTYSGYGVAAAFWARLAADPATTWTVEEVVTDGERATVRWHARFGDGSLTRGVNLVRVREGRIVEATGYAKIS